MLETQFFEETKCVHEDFKLDDKSYWYIAEKKITTFQWELQGYGFSCNRQYGILVSFSRGVSCKGVIRLVYISTLEKAMGRKHNVEHRTEDAFSAIKEFWEKKGMSPTLREIGAKIGIKSTSMVRFYVDKLEKAGRIKRNGTKSRNILIVQGKSPKPAPGRRVRVHVTSLERAILAIPDFGPIAAGIPVHLPSASFSQLRQNHSDPITDIHIPESYLPQGVKVDDVFALHVEGDSMRDAMLTNGDIVILKRTSIAELKGGEIVAAWILDTQETTLKRFERTERGIVLRPENPNYAPLFFQPDELEIQGKLLAVLRFRY